MHELSEKLAPVASAPTEVIRRLACHDEIIVAGPVLATSLRLANCDLVEIARTKSQAHLLAISGRTQLSELVTGVLMDRGNHEVVHRLAKNSGARFFVSGLAALMKRAENNEGVAELLGRRIDIPLDLFRTLLSRATKAVRSRLLSSVKPERQAEFRLVLAKIPKSKQATITRDCTEAQRTVQSMQQAGKLNEAALLLFAISNRYEHVVAALTLLASTPLELVDQLMHGDRIDALLVLCKAAGLEWSTVRAILKVKLVEHSVFDMYFEPFRIEFAKLSMSTAGRVLRFRQVREKTSTKTDKS